MVRVVLDKFQSTGGYRNPPGKLMGHTWALVEERGPAREAARATACQFELDKGWGQCPPFPSPTPPLFPSLLFRKRKKERGILLGLGSPSRTPHTWRAPFGPATSPPPLVAMHILDRSCVIVGKILNYYVPQHYQVR